MISANELMIGDWVKFTSKYGYGTGQVVGIEPLEGTAEPTTFIIWKRDKEGNTKFFVGVSKICVEPIPITPEILEKNGFVYNAIPFVDGWEQFGLTLYRGGNGYRINCGINVSLIIDYVHQLQHALRLCGIEKEIEL